jgi:hypothetical protein
VSVPRLQAHKGAGVRVACARRFRRSERRAVRQLPAPAGGGWEQRKFAHLGRSGAERETIAVRVPAAELTRAILGAFLLAVICLLGCGEPDWPPLARPSVVPRRVDQYRGCWQFSSSLDEYLPSGLTVRFDTSLAHAKDSVFLRLVVQDSSLDKRIRLSGWALAKDTTQLAVFWGNGFSGLTLRLTVRNDTLRGRAYRFVDVPALRSSFPVTATRVSCPQVRHS